MIDRQLLRYLLAVVDRGNFTRAAAACAVTQPTLSAGIARLEAALGTPVFERTSRRVALTPAGARVLAHARRVEAGFAEIERTVRPDPPAMLVRIGIVATLPSPWIEAALTAARAAAPAERIELVEGRMRDLSPRLDRGRLDAVLGILPPDGGAGAGAGEADRPLFTEPYAMALPPDHPLARRASVRVEEVAAGPMIVRRHCEALPAISRFFTARGVRPFMSARVTDDERALACVRAGLGITVMPRGYAGRGIAMPLLNGLNLTRTIGLRQAPGARASRSAALAAFADTIRQAGAA